MSLDVPRLCNPYQLQTSLIDELLVRIAYSFGCEFKIIQTINIFCTFCFTLNSFCYSICLQIYWSPHICYILLVIWEIQNLYECMYCDYVRWMVPKKANAHIRGGVAGYNMGIGPTKHHFPPGNLTEHFDTGTGLQMPLIEILEEIMCKF